MTVAEAQTFCLKQNLPFYSYRLPKQQECCFGAQMEGEVSVFRELGDWKEGFIMVPFQISQKIPAWFIRPDVAFRNETTDAVMIERLLRRGKKEISFIMEETDVCWEEYEEQVKKMIHALQQNRVKKMVLSRTITFRMNAYEMASDWFKVLADRYPEAFVFLVSIPGKLCWMGATPEVFLKQTEAGIETMALAGTRKTGTVGEWGEKEREEQAIVTDYIAHELKTIATRESMQQGPFSKQAGKVEHLCTTFQHKGRLEFSIIDQLRRVLHPTPAVGGVPATKALNLIRRIEKRSRRYYAGYLGPITASGDLDWFVNLRCMELGADQVRLHVGGGITALSDPRKEWEETELKSRTLLDVVGLKLNECSE